MVLRHKNLRPIAAFSFFHFRLFSAEFCTFMYLALASVFFFRFHSPMLALFTYWKLLIASSYVTTHDNRNERAHTYTSFAVRCERVMIDCKINHFQHLSSDKNRIHKITALNFHRFCQLPSPSLSHFRNFIRTFFVAFLRFENDNDDENVWVLETLNKKKITLGFLTRTKKRCEWK